MTNQIANKVMFDNWSISQFEVDICLTFVPWGIKLFYYFHNRLISEYSILIRPSKTKLPESHMRVPSSFYFPNVNKRMPERKRKWVNRKWNICWLNDDIIGRPRATEYGVDVCVWGRPLATIVPARQTSPESSVFAAAASIHQSVCGAVWGGPDTVSEIMKTNILQNLSQAPHDVVNINWI